MTADETTPDTPDEVFTDAERIAILDLLAETHDRAKAGNALSDDEIAARVAEVVGED